MKTTTDHRLILEVHAIQGFATNNLNRDDVGSPKDCVFGGVRRARISSQAWKRAMRTAPVFKEIVLKAGGDTGVRTRGLKDALVQRLTKIGVGDDTTREKVATRAITEGMGLSFSTKNPNHTQYLLYLGKRDIDDLAGYLGENFDKVAGENIDKATLKKAVHMIVSGKGKSYASDVALFGRMFADDKSLNVDGASQVAQSISTHALHNDIDYFTAVDDLLGQDESGAGMIGQIEMNGSCHYRYLNVDIGMIWDHLGVNHDLTSATIEGLLRAVAEALPTGKQNSMAAHNPPYYIEVLLREDLRRWSLQGAFSRPVRVKNGESSLEENSVQRLRGFRDQIIAAYGAPHNEFRLVTHVGSKDSTPFPELVKQMVEEIKVRTSAWTG